MGENIKAKEPKVNPPDYPTAVDYAFRIPANPITLTSIRPDTPTITRTFKKSQIGRRDAIAWVTAQQKAGRNIYYQDCSVASVNKRPVKADVSFIHAAHVDVDVQGTLDADEFAKAKAVLLDRIEAYQPAPSDIIDTGNGVQAFWYLCETFAATPENIAAVEGVSKRIAADLGGDACHDVAHLVRLPSTWNFPNAKKQALGRVKCQSRIVRDEQGLIIHLLASLPSAPVDAATNDNTDPLSYVGIGSPDIPDNVDLSSLAPDVQKLIREGATVGADRSAAVYKVACDLRRFKFTDGQILYVITNPDFGISDHVLEQKQREPIEQASRVIGRMNKEGVAYPEFANDPPPPPTETDRKNAEVERQFQERRQRERDRKQEKQQQRRERTIKGLVVSRGDDIEIENLQFVWKNVLARGVHTAMAGEGGGGKSQVTYNIAAAITNGGTLPDGSKAPQGNVVILNAEDSTRTMFGPRLIAAGADMKFVYKVQAVASTDGPDTKFSLQNDLEKLKAFCEEIGNVVLVIIDPASSYMGGTLDGRQNTQVRAVLDPISKLAEDCDFAVLSVTHFNKGIAVKAIHRVMDSAAFVTAPRAVWAVFAHPDNGIGSDNLFNRKMSFVQLKTNIAPPDLPGWTYHMEMVAAGKSKSGETVMATRIVWDGVGDLTADQIVAAENERASPRTDEAMEFVRRVLDDGPMLIEEVKQQAEAEGIAERTLLNAKRRLGVEATVDGPGQPWKWSLPAAKAEVVE
jgi:putative DNA primase/helicase